MALSAKKDGNCVIIQLPENIDMLRSSIIEKELNDTLQKEAGYNIIMDLNDVKLISSSGLRIFITLKRKLHEKGLDIVLCNIKDETIINMFNASKITEIFSIFPSVEKAKEYLQKNES